MEMGVVDEALETRRAELREISKAACETRAWANKKKNKAAARKKRRGSNLGW